MNFFFKSPGARTPQGPPVPAGVEDSGFLEGQVMKAAQPLEDLREVAGSDSVEAFVLSYTSLLQVRDAVTPSPSPLLPRGVAGPAPRERHIGRKRPVIVVLLHSRYSIGRGG